ncbi:hypothetical protein HMSSN036_49270 [Paenibacillus macerans]|nr:hypothetical protein HMSSN036_49270 [Paenibacillus macerans]
MAKEKVTIQDIADALGISRNTASKALNGSESIPAETRNKVIRKAIELKYKQFAFMDSDSFLSKSSGNIALLTENLPNTSHFGSTLISGLEKESAPKATTCPFISSGTSSKIAVAAEQLRRVQCRRHHLHRAV